MDKLDANDPEVSVKVDQINALQGDLDQVEQKLKDINDVPVAPDTAPAKKGFEEVGKSAESARSVTANAVGNLTQDIGGLGGVAGSAGVAFGQMGEYMTEAAASGEGLSSVLKNFGTQGVLIGGLTLAVSLFTAEIEKARKASEQNEKQTDDLFKAFSQGTTLVEAYTKAVQDSGKLEFGGIGDILPKLNNLNISVAEFSRLAQLTPDQLKVWADGQRKVTDEGTPAFKDLTDVVLTLAEAHGNAVEAEDRHQNTVKALADQVDHAASSTEALTTKNQQLQFQIDRTSGAFDALAGAVNLDSEFHRFEDGIDGMQAKVASGTALASSDIDGLKSDIIQLARDAKANPAEVKSTLDKIDQGDLAGVKADAERYYQARPVVAQGTVDFTKVLFPSANQSGALLKPTGATYSLGLSGGAGAAPFAAADITTVTVNVPRGTRPDDMVRAADRYARRNGRGRALRR
ncbi:MAG TPA: hypothetical protein VGH94_12055 [Acidimicrobiales bacterium]